MTSLAFVALLLAQAPVGTPTAAPTAAPVPVDRASPPTRPHLRAVRTTQRPLIDGKLDDLAWRSAIASDTFTQHFPNEGAPPSERTEVRILYDDDALYVGVDCTQVKAPVVKRLMRRDTQLPSDGVWMDIDSRRDGATAFHFSINAAGVLGDAIHFNDTDYSSDWDAVWEGRAADTDHGYAVEFRIPLRVLRFAALPIQDWGFQVRRFIDARQETDDWAFFSRSAGSYVPGFGRIDDLSELRPHHAVELRPFVLGRLRHRAADASAVTLAHGWDVAGSAGLDAKAAVTNELTLDLAVNPDFGQVEADAVILNLSTFETFFPEKRPFFLEGIDTFASIRPLLYTRRIGRQPPSPALATGETLVDTSEPSPIYGAAKLVGTLGGRTTVGLLSAVTGQSVVEVQVPDAATGPHRVRRVLDPLTAFNVLRLKRLWGSDAEVGLLATATNRLEAGFNDAYVASVDGRWRSPSGDYAATGQALVTTLVGGPPRAARDGIAVRPGTLAGGGSLLVGKQGGPHWLWGATQHLTGRQLEFNDLGYLDRKNDYQGSFSVVYRTIEPWWRTVETRTTLQADLRETLDGINLANTAQLSTWWLLSNFWTVSVELDCVGAYHDDREMGDGAALQRARRGGVSASLGSDPRRRVIASLYGQALRLGNGRHLETHAQVTFRVLPQLELDVIPTATVDDGEPRYVSTLTTDPVAGSSYLLGTQQARSLGATLRGAYTFTPNLSLQIYSQAFLARVHYTSFFQSPMVGFRQRVDLSSLTPATAPAAADSLTATLNINVVMRWEYRLGSTLFLVYTRAQTPALSVPPGGATSLDLRPVVTGRAAVDVIMLKLAYWWG